MLTGYEMGNYLIGPMLGKGSFGEIYVIYDRTSNSFYGMKMEPRKTKRRVLDFEIQVLKELNSPYFPKYIGSGRTQRYTYLTMELLGPSLSTIKKKLPRNQFTLSTALRSMSYALSAIQALHSYGIIHRDIKPGNILIRHNHEHPFVLIDFGLSRIYINKETHQLIPPRRRPGFRGTAAYASINAHKCLELSRRDDIISWFYMTLDLIKPNALPWKRRIQNETLFEVKYTTDMNKLTSKISPYLTEIWNLIEPLKFEDEPDYERIKQILAQYMNENNIQETDVWDWHPNIYSMDNDENLDSKFFGESPLITSLTNNNQHDINDFLLSPKKKNSCNCNLL